MATDHGDPRAAEPAWFRDRSATYDFDSMRSSAALRHSERDDVRTEMRDELLHACRLVQKGDDWSLKDCEEFSQSLALLADGVIYLRASLARHGAPSAREQQYLDIAERVVTAGAHVLVTEPGQPDIVMMPAAEYEELRREATRGHDGDHLQ